MFTLYHSNQLDLLKQLVLKLSKDTPLSNPFEKEMVLIQSPGMAQWLKLEVAKELGIAANIDFVLPATFIWQSFTKILPDIPEQSAFNKEVMIFKIMALLPQYLHMSEFTPLAHYLRGDIEPDRSYQLAEKIADIYDQYLVYRPEWILSWETGESIEPLDLKDDEFWQPILWKALVDSTLESGASLYHRANLYQGFIEALNEQSASQLPKRIFVFGISAIPPQYLNLLKAMGEYIDIHFMLNNPCQAYWGDIHERENPGNSLLASMGKLGRDNLYLLTQLEPNEIDAYVEPQRDTLLHHIQADILALEDRSLVNDPELEGDRKDRINTDDVSLSFHSCHSPMREIEVLQDYLLKTLDENPQLSPRDILVMVADIDAYAPAVRAVFGNATGKNYIPFAISDQLASSDNPVLQAFLQILSLPKLRCSAEDILSLLEVPAIMQRFSIQTHEFELIKHWVVDVGARWGLDEKTATYFDLLEQKQNTWLFALERMLLGYAMPESAGLFEQRIAYDEVQGLDAQIAGKVALFIHHLITTREQLCESHVAQDWQRIVNTVLDDFFATESENEKLMLTIRQQLQALCETTQQASYPHALHLEEIKLYLNRHIAQDKASQRFLSGQLNICTLMPMRSIPFKMICLLGMNDGAYPRSMPPLGFDLMTHRAKAGDRSRRDDDRYLFLEAMQAAEEQLYISYIGRSIVDNSEKVASVLVSELLEYCQSGFYLQGDELLSQQEKEAHLRAFLIKQHALTPYSPQTFIDGSYVEQWLAIAQGVREEEFEFGQLTREQDVIDDSLELSHLKYFMRLPVKGFFNMRLKVDMERESSELDDSEAFSFDKREAFGIKMQLLEQVKECQNLNTASEILTQRLSAQGVLPLGAGAQLSIQACHKDVEKVYTAGHPLMASADDDIEINLPIWVDAVQKEIQLQGWIKGVYAMHLVRERLGYRRMVDIILAWLDHLCICAIDNSECKQTYLISTDKITTFLTIEKGLAQKILGEWISFMFKGLQRPIVFFPKTAEAILSMHYDKKQKVWNDALLWDGETSNDIESDLKKLNTVFNGGYKISGESDNPYIKRLWPQLTQEMIKQMDEDVMTYLYPIQAYMEEESL